MSLGNKIGISGKGKIGRLLHSASTAIMLSGANNEKSDLTILKIITSEDYTKLVQGYKKVRTKYYPERDILIKNKKGET